MTKYCTLTFKRASKLTVSVYISIYRSFAFHVGEIEIPKSTPLQLLISNHFIFQRGISARSDSVSCYNAAKLIYLSMDSSLINDPIRDKVMRVQRFKDAEFHLKIFHTLTMTNID